MENSTADSAMKIGEINMEPNDWKEKAERYESLAISTQALLNIALSEIKTLNQKIEDLEEEVWQLKKENLRY